MKTILISFQPKWFEQIRTGEKIFEYRTQFPKEPVRAYMYISKPVQAIIGYIEFGSRISLETWAHEYRNDLEVYSRIQDYMNRRRYVVPILKYLDIEPICLKDLNSAINKFVIPQSYYYLDNYPELLDYVRKNTVFGTYEVNNTFESIDRNKICQLRK